MAKRTVRDFDVAGKRALVRVDFNVPLKDGRVTDDTRIRASLPTIAFLREQGCRVVLMSHLGRPKDAPDPAFALDPVAMRLGQLLEAPVRKLSELTGPGVEAAVASMKAGDVVAITTTITPVITTIARADANVRARPASTRRRIDAWRRVASAISPSNCGRCCAW